MLLSYGHYYLSTIMVVVIINNNNIKIIAVLNIQ